MWWGRLFKLATYRPNIVARVNEEYQKLLRECRRRVEVRLAPRGNNSGPYYQPNAFTPMGRAIALTAGGICIP